MVRSEKNPGGLSLKNEVNADLLAFLKSERAGALNG
jgi:hypothetical protein